MRCSMWLRRLCVGAVALVSIAAVSGEASAFDDSKYPNLKGQWDRVGSPAWVPPGAPPAPLTPEYQAIFEANLADQAAGGPGDVPSFACIPQGMPMMMNLYDPMELIVTPDETYILISHVDDSYRRIYTDGRDWPEDAAPTYAGYSIGKWIDEDGDGRYDALEIETRRIKGPHAYDASGLPFHRDNAAVIKERIYLDKADPDILYDRITVFDHALTQPWTMLKKAHRNPNPRPVWLSEVCSEDTNWVRIGKDAYFLSADGYLMPVRKDQPPPDLRYFKQK